MTDPSSTRPRWLPPLRRGVRLDPGPEGAARVVALLREAPRQSYGMAVSLRRFFGRYVRGQVPAHHVEQREVTLPGRLLERAEDQPDVQVFDAGVGPAVHRVFRARIRSPRTDARGLVRKLRDDVNVGSPTEVSVFEKMPRSGASVQGEEWVVRMPGPWSAPIRLLAEDETSFAFVTLRGHMEAGVIEFRATDDDGSLLFEISTWARSGDRLYHLLYDVLSVGRTMQLHMWVSFCEQVAEASGGRIVDRVQVVTHRWPQQSP